MKKIVQSLFELQKLPQTGKKDSLDPESRIACLRKEIPAAFLVNFDRFQMRGKKGVAIVRNGVCTECHLTVPIGVVAALAAGAEIQRCGNCGRYLYLPENEAVVAPVVPVKPVKVRRKKESQTQLAHVD